jgi:hypothetical protein
MRILINKRRKNIRVSLALQHKQRRDNDNTDHYVLFPNKRLLNVHTLQTTSTHSFWHITTCILRYVSNCTWYKVHMDLLKILQLHRGNEVRMQHMHEKEGA